jgi:DNA helicase HerA-like ATPase
MLLLESENATPKPVKTIPAHFSDVFLAEEEDVNQVFGQEDAKHWHIGSPLDLENVKVNFRNDSNRVSVEVKYPGAAAGYYHLSAQK